MVALCVEELSIQHVIKEYLNGQGESNTNKNYTRNRTLTRPHNNTYMANQEDGVKEQLKQQRLEHKKDSQTSGSTNTGGL